MTGPHARVLGRQKKRRKGTVVSKSSHKQAVPTHSTILLILWWVIGVVMVSGTLAACMSGVYKAIETSQLFALQGIEVVGNSRIPADEILGTLRDYTGANVVTLDTEELSRRLEGHPWIAHVSIIKRFPHTLTIKITERQPLALMAAGELYYVDSEGFVFSRVDAGDTRDYPLITGFSKDDIPSQPGICHRRVAEAVRLLTIIRDYPGMIPVSELHFDTQRGWTIYPLADPAPVYLGFGEFEQKIINFTRIHHDVLEQDLPPVLIDLSYPCQVVVKKAPQEHGTRTAGDAKPSRTATLDTAPST